MDFQFWLYLIIAVIYILSRALKKNEQQSQDEKPGPQRREPSHRQQQQPAANKPKQLTFEELLREIQEAKQPKPSPPQPRAPEPVVIDYDDNLKEEEEDLETIDYDYRKKDKIYDVYEEAKRQAFNRPSLEETMNVRNTEVKFEKFKVFNKAKEKNLLEEYTKDFKDPNGWKKAVVMSEILNRKF